MAEEEFEPENDDEINIEDDEPTDEELEEIEYVYGVAMPPLPEGMRPLECVVLIHGVMMDTGASTITAVGSDGMTPWLAVGMMDVESHRLKMSYTMHAETSDWDDEDWEEEDE